MASTKDTRAGREALYKKLESAGCDVGRRVAERCVYWSPTPSLPQHVHGTAACDTFALLSSLTRDFTTIGDTLEVIKFICRELWVHLFGKAINQLQTNNRVRST